MNAITRTVLMLASSAALTACEAPEPEDLTFRYQLTAAPSTLDPARTGDVYSSGVIDRLFDGLMRLDRVRNVPEPELAASYSVSDDGLVYTFRLLPEARFHHGRPIRASDFKFSWERVLAPATGSPKAWLFELIDGADAFRAGEAESVAGIEAEDPHLLRVRLDKPFVPFLYHLARPAASVVPEEEVRALGESFARQPVGSGPFRFQSWEGDRVTLAAFDDHARRPPEVRHLIYEIAGRDEALRRYQVGELDLMSSIPAGSLASLRQTFSADLRLFPGTLWSGFCFRCDQEPFDDPRVRRAFSLAVDRDALVRELGELQRTASVGFVPQGIPGHEPSTLTHGLDLEQARGLLAEAAYPGGAGFPAQVYHADTREGQERIARFLIAAFSGLGVQVDHQAMDFSSRLKALKEGRLKLFFYSWGGEYPDPEPYLRPLFHSRGPSNAMAYSNPEVDRLLDAAQVESDPAHRRALYRRAEALIVGDAPCVALYQITAAILLRPRWQDIPVGYQRNYLEIELARWAEER